MRGKLQYLAPRVEDQLVSRMSWIRKPLRRLAWKGFLAAGRPLPVPLRSPYILDVYRHALRSYVPQPYPGRVTLFRFKRASYPPSLDWLKLLSGDLKVYECDGEYAHEDLTREPYVSQWAERLQASLCEGQVVVAKAKDAS